MGKHEGAASPYWVYRREDDYLGVVKASSEDAANTLLKFLPHSFTLMTPHFLTIEEARERIDSERRDREL